MTLKEHIRRYRRKRAFAALLRSFGHDPKRWMLNLAVADDLDRPYHPGPDGKHRRPMYIEVKEK